MDLFKSAAFLVTFCPPVESSIGRGALQSLCVVLDLPICPHRSGLTGFYCLLLGGTHT